MQLHYINGEPTPETAQYIHNIETIRALEQELGLEKYGLYSLSWDDVKALYDGSRLTYAQLEIVYNRMKAKDTSIYNTYLDEDGNMVDGKPSNLVRNIKRALGGRQNDY
ncbi:hypothetical protein CN520_23095 [Bacillus cereus]|nr:MULTISPECIES: hypothetical protein [Bacteria]PDZ37321.1 hypothetical protein CON18_26180 [Bacillus cereus]PET38225.1 hypothetical protein CN520_23095 [Bacillus cereus]PFA12444.1 hypothetical protein CN377_14890 [Bacillus cereus]PFE32904.1 hypothetical protein CN294_30825 [Bacillus cereus]PFS81042.1 hypothetical protein COK49_11700 [Bacillus cereus]